MARMVRPIVVILVLGVGAFLSYRGALRLGHLAGAARWRAVRLSPGPIVVPRVRPVSFRDRSPSAERIVGLHADAELPDWQTGGKVAAPRVLLAKFALGRDLDAANAYLAGQRPWGRSGSTWAGHKEGDYDFTLYALTLILYLYGDRPEVLYPATREHMLNVLLVEEGGTPSPMVPRSLGLVRDTENHLLMTEGSRYLKNRWLALHGNADPRFDNVRNGLEDWLLSLLRETAEAGLYEFNSVPYIAYTLTAVMNLEAFGSEPVSEAAREILDRLNWEYALGSLNLRRYAPFRRQLRRAGETALNADYHTTLMTVWMSLQPDAPDTVKLPVAGAGHALWACLLPYRLPERTAAWVGAKEVPYFVRIGRGPGASPEIYSGGPGYLISAGGVHRGRRSMIVARPITLMLEDGAVDVSGVIRLAGPGEDFREWNNTGVYRDFACAAGPVRIPDGHAPAAESDGWAVYRAPGDLLVAVYSSADLGILCLFQGGDPADVLRSVAAANPDTGTLRREFRRPNGECIAFDLDAPRSRWVIRAVDGEPRDREFDRWPRMDGTLGALP